MRLFTLVLIVVTAGCILLNALSLRSLLVCSITLYVWLSGRAEMVWMGRAGHYAFEIGWHDGRIFAGDRPSILNPQGIDR